MKRTYVKTPTIFQMEGTECGAASLAMIMAYYGKHIPLDVLRVDTGVSRDGCRARRILSGARKYGFVTEGYRMGLEALTKMSAPCIIHWNFNHFVVYEGIKGKHAYLNDPAQGRRKLTMEELDEGFTGVVLQVLPGKNFVKEKNQQKFSKLAVERLKGQGTTILFLLILGIMTVVPALLEPVFSQTFIDDIMIGGNRDWLYTLIIGMLTAVLVRAGFTFWRSRMIIRLQNKVSMLTAYQFLNHLFRLPMFFFDQRYTGDIVSRVDSNHKVSEFIIGDLAENVLNLCMSALFFGIMLTYSPLLSLVGAAGLAANAVVLKTASTKLSKNFTKLQQDEGKLLGIMFAGINMISTLKASGVENKYVGRLFGNYGKCITQKQSYGKMQQVANAIPSMISKVSSILVLVCGATLVMKGQMTVGMLIAFNLILNMFSDPINKLIGFVQKMQEVKADMLRVQDIERYQEDSVYNQRTETDALPEKMSGKIELKDISFGYSRLDPPLIENFFFKLQPGKSVAFFGASGSGKSTVAKLVSGLYLPWDGQILVDNTNIGNVPEEVRNCSVSTVSQEISLFAGTIRDNLTMWNPNIRDADIISAAKDAGIHEMITQKPGAYEYQLTEGGRNLSGGQRQRLEIARALVINPTILVMDEATSALDSLLEKQIIDNIKRRGCTCIIVAHRVSAIRDCDEIIVMSSGKIAERGTHEQLMLVGGIYHALIAAV